MMNARFFRQWFLVAACVASMLLSYDDCHADTAGKTTPGTTNYPNAWLTPGNVAVLGAGESSAPLVSIFDTTRSAVYFGVGESLVKVDAITGQRVGALSLGEPNTTAGISRGFMDEEEGSAYFVVDVENSGIRQLVQVNLTTFAVTNRVTLTSSQVSSVVHDSAAHVAYFGTYSAPAKIIKFDLSTLTEISSLTMTVEESQLTSAVIDPGRGYAYFASSQTSPGKIVRIRLSDFSRVDAITLGTTETYLDCAAIDPAAGIAYFGTSSYIGAVVRINLDTFTRLGALNLNDFNLNLVLDPSRNVGYAMGGGSPRLIKTFSLSPFQKTTSIPINSDLLFCGVLDSTQNVLWTATRNLFKGPAKVFKVDLTTKSVSSEFFLLGGQNEAKLPIVYGGFTYFATDTNPSLLLKVDCASLAIVNSLQLPDDVGYPRSAVLDPESLCILYGYSAFPAPVDTYQHSTPHSLVAKDDSRGEKSLAPRIVQAPSRIVMLDLPTFETSGTLLLEPDETNLAAAVIDPSGRAAYFASGQDGGGGANRVIKVDVDTLARVDAVALSAPPNMSATIDVANTAAFFECGSAFVQKIELSPFSAGPSNQIAAGHWKAFSHRALTDATGMNSFFMSSYLRNQQIPDVGIQITKFAHSPFGQVAGSVGGLGETFGLWEDTTGNSFLLNNHLTISRFSSETMNLMGAAPTSVFPTPFSLMKDAQEDHDGNRLIGTTSSSLTTLYLSHFGTARTSAITLSRGGTIDGMRFYSHLSEGDLRLAIYDDATPRNLLWQSDSVVNNVTDGEIAVPIANGLPSTLHLTAGNYWLAWQTNSKSRIGSYASTSGNAQNFVFLQSFGSFPTTVTGIGGTFKEQWTQYLDYTADPPTPSPTASPSATASLTSTPSISPSTSPTSSATPTETETPTATPTVSPSPTEEPEAPNVVGAILGLENPSQECDSNGDLIIDAADVLR